jgi:hypothetical protein
LCELSSLGTRHGCITVGLSTDVDRDGAAGVALTISASDICIVGLVLNVPGHLGAVHGVWDVDWVVMAAVRVIDNEPCRRVVGVSLLGFSVVVNRAESILRHRKRFNSELGCEWVLGSGIVDWGVFRRGSNGGSGGGWCRDQLDKLSKASRRHIVEGRIVKVGRVDLFGVEWKQRNESGDAFSLLSCPLLIAFFLWLCFSSS